LSDSADCTTTVEEDVEVEEDVQVVELRAVDVDDDPEDDVENVAAENDVEDEDVDFVVEAVYVEVDVEVDVTWTTVIASTVTVVLARTVCCSMNWFMIVVMFSFVGNSGTGPERNVVTV